MIQEDKNLLLKDFCGRLPYGVKIHKEGSELDGTLIDTELRNDLIVITTPMISVCTVSIESCKPYLRSLSSMTEEENEMYTKLNLFATHWDFCDWCNKHMFDYRGLIEKGLALEAPEDMYKKEEEK